MHTITAPSSFDFTDHQVRTTPRANQSTSLSSYQTPSNLIKDVFFPNDTITEQTTHSLKKMSKRMAQAAKKKVATKSKAKTKTKKAVSKVKITKSRTSLKATKPKKTTKTKRKKVKAEEPELLTGKGFNIRHF